MAEKSPRKKAFFRGYIAVSDREYSVVLKVIKAQKLFLLIVKIKQTFGRHISNHSDVRVRFVQICFSKKSDFRQGAAASLYFTATMNSLLKDVVLLLLQ
ncbi:MAG: hypothetical protein J6Y81_14355 [Ruminococcus sp.]|nr:hypothetical protein [Ruminococcus sp.]